MLIEDCMACDVLAGRIESPGGVIYTNDAWMLDHSVSPVVLPGFLILKPRRHVEHLAELTAEEMASFGEMLRLACVGLERVLQPAKTYACSFGEAVGHVHFYIIPRGAGMPASGLDVLHQMMVERRWASLDADQKAAEIADRVRDEILRLLAEA